MNLTLVVEPAAEVDILEAYIWYEERQTGLGNLFLDTLDAVFSKVSAHPKLYSEVIPGVHRAVTDTFPYLVFYTLTNSRIHILAIIHAAQNPLWIEERAKR